MSNKSAIVVGAGLAGLSAAHYLQKAGWKVTVLEALDRVGGRVRTIEQGGYLLDVGSTQFTTGYTEYLALMKEVGLDSDVVESSQLITVINQGRQYEFDGSGWLSAAISPMISLGSKFTLLKTFMDFYAIKPRLDVLDISLSHAVDTESALQYCERRLNREIYDVLVDALVRSWVFTGGKDVSCLEWFSAVANLGGQRMISLKGGQARMPQAIAKGLDVRLGCPVQSVRKLDAGGNSSGSVEVSYNAADGSAQTITADACVFASRLTETIAMYPEAKQIAGKLATELRYNRGLVVTPGFSKRTKSNALGVLVPTVEKPEIALIWLEHNKNRDRAPEGHSMFSVYFDHNAGDRFFNMPEDELVAFTVQYLEHLYPEIKGTLDMSNVTRWPLGIPHTAPGIYTAVDAMKKRIDPNGPIQFAGDYFTCTGQNTAVHWGKRAAANLINQGR